jgi:hypothetical protein
MPVAPTAITMGDSAPTPGARVAAAEAAQAASNGDAS